MNGGGQVDGNVLEGIDPLTGLYDRKTFFEVVDKKLPQIKPGTYCLIAVDIEHFRLYNQIYGRKEGDYLLEYVADCLKNMLYEQMGAAGYLGGDNFGIFIPDQKELLENLNTDITNGVKRISHTVGFLPAFGVCEIDDLTFSAVTLYDRATLALSQVIGNYTNRICYYDDSMTDQIEEEINLLSEIQKALENQEFTFFAQPQCDISTGKIVGAESLVRWYHHSKGLISPGVFIPVLEKNGFIADLDRYVWDKVCAWIKSWLDRGYRPVPISINVSRIDIFSMDVPAYLLHLVEKYGLKTYMLKIEITESAYAENNDKIKKTVKDLQEAGFLVMMDDFGSGYSSLNMLKNVAVDVLKIDMRFLDISEQEQEKGIGILESVVNMSRQMGVPIIVEGVETKKQEDFLLGMGCRYTQGFYYYKPLPISEFEKLLTDQKNLDFDGLWCKKVEALHIRELLDSNLFSDTMLNNLLGATAFYDIHDNQIEITRMNDQYYRLAGITSDEDADNSRKFWNHVPDEEQEMLFSVFEEAYVNPLKGAQGYVHYKRTDGKMLWVYLKVFFLRERDGHKLFYSSLTDVTFLREEKHRIVREEQHELDKTQTEYLAMYYGDLPCAFGVIKTVLNGEKKPCHYDLVYANREMEHICGDNLQRLQRLAEKHLPKSFAAIMAKIYQAACFGEMSSDYIYSSNSSRYLKLSFYQYAYGYAGCLVKDITHEQIKEHALQSTLRSYREVYSINLEDNYYRMIYPDETHMLERGNYEQAIDRHFETGQIADYDKENVRNFLKIDSIRQALDKKDIVEYKYKRCYENDQPEWCLTSICVSERINGKPETVIVMIRSIEELMKDA